MTNNPNNENAKKPPMSDKKKKIILISAIAALLLILIILVVSVFVLSNRNKPAETEPSTVETTTAETTEEPTEETTEETTEPAPIDPEMLPDMAELYSKNSDIIGWLKIDDTKMDYPVMHTPEDFQKYLHLNFDGNYSFEGLPFLRDECSMDPESDVLIIYGHNMNNGSMFRTVFNYRKEAYWEEHPIIQFTTLYEEREYEIVAAFYDRIYSPSSDVFKFYKFTGAETEEEFDAAIQYFKDKAQYDTGVEAEFGDKLMTLITCSSHDRDGRFVVVARMIEPETEAAPESTEANS